MDDSTENALFVVENEGKTVYIPISEDFITEIDEQGKQSRWICPKASSIYDPAQRNAF